MIISRNSLLLLLVFFLTFACCQTTDFEGCCSNEISTLPDCISGQIALIKPSYGSVYCKDILVPDNSTYTCFSNGIIVSNPALYSQKNGDENFCLNNTCSPSSQLYCYSSRIEQECKDSLGQVVEPSVETFSCRNGLSESESRKRFVIPNKINVFDYLVDFNGTVISFVFPDNSPKIIYVTKDQIFTVFSINTTTFVLPISNYTTAESSPLIIYIYSNSIEAYQATFYIGTAISCFRPACSFCYEMLNAEWSCLSTVGKIALILFLIALFSVLIIMMPYVGQSLAKTIVVILLFPLIVIWYFFRYLYRCKNIPAVMWLIRKFETVKTGLTPVDVTRTMVIILIFAPVVLSGSCDTTNSILLTPVSTTTINSTYSNITYAPVYTSLSFVAPRTTQCLALTQSGVTTNVGSITIDYNEIFAKVSPDYIYGTSDWHVHKKTVFRCWTGTDTCSSDTCSSMASSQNFTDLVLQRLGDPKLYTFPGQEFCLPGGNGPFYGCFFNIDGCLFSGYSIIPQGNTYSVYNLRSATFFFNVTICVYTAGLNKCNTFLLNEFQTATVGEVSLNIVSIGVSSTNFLVSDLRLIAGNDSTAYLGSTSNLNAPQYGNIGDIQFQSRGLADNGTFIYDTGVLDKITNNLNSVDFAFHKQGIKQLTNVDAYKQLPLYYDGAIFTYDGSYLYARQLQNTLTVSLNFNGSSIPVPVVSQGCATCKLLNFTGYTGTIVGFDFYLSCYTDVPSLYTVTTTSAYVIIRTTQVKVQSINVLSPDIIVIHATSVVTTNTGQVILTSKSSCPSSVTFNGVLAVSLPELDNQQDNLVVANSSYYKVSPTYTSSSTTDWTPIIIAIISLIVVIIASALGCFGVAASAGFFLLNKFVSTPSTSVSIPQVSIPAPQPTYSPQTQTLPTKKNDSISRMLASRRKAT